MYDDPSRIIVLWVMINFIVKHEQSKTGASAPRKLGLWHMNWKLSYIKLVKHPPNHASQTIVSFFLFSFFRGRGGYLLWTMEIQHTKCTVKQVKHNRISCLLRFVNTTPSVLTWSNSRQDSSFSSRTCNRINPFNPWSQIVNQVRLVWPWFHIVRTPVNRR